MRKRVTKCCHSEIGKIERRNLLVTKHLCLKHCVILFHDLPVAGHQYAIVVLDHLLVLKCQL